MKYIFLVLISFIFIGLGFGHTIQAVPPNIVNPRYNWQPPVNGPPGWTWEYSRYMGWHFIPPPPGEEYYWVYGPDHKPIMMHGGKIVEKETK